MYTCLRAATTLVVLFLSLSARPAAGQDGSARDTLRIALVGDINFARSLARVYLFGGRGDEILAGVRDALRAADIAVGNLESQLLERGDHYDPAGSPVFAAPAGLALPVLRDAGFDVLGTANNHAWDFGRAGLLENVAHLDTSGMAATGTGASRGAALRPVVVRRNGWTVVFFSLTWIFNYENLSIVGHEAECCVAWADTLLMRDRIATVRDSVGADLVIVFVHAGLEYELAPREPVIRLFRGLARAGADAVIGHHPHVPQGVEVIDGRPVVYSLGNFVFKQYRPWTDRGLMAMLTWYPDGTHHLDLLPLVVGYTPRFATGADSAATMRRVAESTARIRRLPDRPPRRNVARPRNPPRTP